MFLVRALRMCQQFPPQEVSGEFQIPEFDSSDLDGFEIRPGVEQGGADLARQLGSGKGALGRLALRRYLGLAFKTFRCGLLGSVPDDLISAGEGSRSAGASEPRVVIAQAARVTGAARTDFRVKKEWVVGGAQWKP